MYFLYLITMKVISLIYLFVVGFLLTFANTNSGAMLSWYLRTQPYQGLPI